MNYVINDFSGPLDLLLRLVKDSKVDIYDINIVEIIDQYMSFINRMEELNLNVASEYLVMAAELMEIKSNMLLPRHEISEEEEDPRENLINRLIEYERYKNVISSLKNYELERNNFYSKEPYDLNEIIDNKSGIDESFSTDDLVAAFNKMLMRKELEKPLSTKIATKEYSVTERSNEIKNILKTKKSVKFDELFDIRTKDYVVVTFLSILTMARNQELIIKQDNNFDSIYLEQKGDK